MIKSPIFLPTFILLVIIGVLNIIAHKLYLYWTVWWYDMLMHFSAGFAVGMAGILIWQLYFDRNISIKKTVFVSIFFSLVVGIAWEFFEIGAEITSFAQGMEYITDTSSDIVLDLSGGILGSLYAHRLLSKVK